METSKINQPYQIPTGSIRTIGEFGNPYIVSDKVELGIDGKILVEIEFLESVIKDRYPLNEILLDPKA